MIDLSDLFWLLALFGVFVIGFLIGRYFIEQSHSDSYWRGRMEGWNACEEMVIERISDSYPGNKDEMYEEIIQ